MRPLFVFVLAVVATVQAALSALPVAQSDVRETPSTRAAPAAWRLDRIRELVEAAIAEKQLPGAVVLIGRRDEVVYEEAFGHRAVVPAVETMTRDTLFDVASLTKVVATTPSVMLLVEEGRVRLDESVARYIPEVGTLGKERVSIRHLLTHTSGLRSGLDLESPFSGAGEAIARIAQEVPDAAPGERFTYSDLNFVLLGEVVARASGERLDRFAARRIFEPLGMRDTLFNPPAERAPTIAPTEPCAPLEWPCRTPGAAMLRGTVHDPTARRMGGVAGHAGLFSTAADLARFARMILNGGTLDGARVLSPASVARMTTAATPPGMSDVRGLGWDIDSRYSANRGDLFPVGSFGHTGFTGTSIWIDPDDDLFVLFLSNRVHPDGSGDVTPLRARVATVAAAGLIAEPRLTLLRERTWNSAPRTALPAPAAPSRPAVLAGVDVLEREGFARLRGKRVGLLTNHAGRTRAGTRTADAIRAAPGVQLAALFSPEHGITGLVDDKVASSRDEGTGLAVHSLYGETLRPTPEMLAGLDLIVADLPDIGTRFFTYATTLAYVMEEAGKRRIPVLVLDRPNPIGGVAVEGPLLDAQAIGFTGYLSMPIRHGLTLGELAALFNTERNLQVDLTVVAAANWDRRAWFDETGLPWTNPSPNMRNLLQATLYPGIGALETANISVGRGTDSPFEQIGAPWIDGGRLADELNRRAVPGVRFYPVTFTPQNGARFGGERCSGVFMIITDREALKPVRMGVEIAAALVRLHGTAFQIDRTARLLGSSDTIARLKAGEDPASIARTWEPGEAAWRIRRVPYLLYE
jgi:uncharacterized protein YbbC (DUF1343 family)/CubicO group peptidase (beta-lactamase class C family)